MKEGRVEAFCGAIGVWGRLVGAEMPQKRAHRTELHGAHRALQGRLDGCKMSR